MIIKQFDGYELEKSKSNTFEDFFNRSEVTFIEEGEEKTFQVLYLRHFDEQFSTFTPFTEDPVFSIGSKEVTFKEIVALVCLLKNPGYRHRKRVYINNLKNFEEHFKGIKFEKFQEMISQLLEKNQYEIKTPLEFIEQ
ncbi:hypothetical protein [Fredinandcohnia sp. 179-A 10B2 NHS]|uniref:hypothetical protein n=1 Tax=Fredinandcohnia sp. 179-A 10B2 NHS TaxID=3235176 RepID=UPI0039A3D2B2